MSTFRTCLLALMLIVPASALAAEQQKQATLYKNPQCGCCEGHAEYLRSNGIQVKTVETHNMSLIRRQHGVTDKFVGCHIMLIEGYVVEGHVPVSAIRKMLTERPKITGISLPGMPEGSPGMGGTKTAPFEVLEIGDAQGKPRVYAVE